MCSLMLPFKCCHGARMVPYSGQGGAMIWASGSVLLSVVCSQSLCLTREVQQCRIFVVWVPHSRCCHGVQLLAQAKARHLPE